MDANHIEESENMPPPLRKAMTILSACYHRIVGGLVAIGATLIVFMTLSIGASVLFRRTPVNFAWALESSEYILIITTLFGAGWLMRTGGHIRVDIVSTHLHGRARDLYDGLIFSIVSLVCLCFTLIGIQATWEAYLGGVIEEKVYLRFPKWMLLGLFPVAGIFMFVESSKSAVACFKKFMSGRNGNN